MVLINNKNNQSILDKLEYDLWGDLNIHFLSLFKVYSDNTCALISPTNTKKWNDFFIEFYLDREIMSSRLSLGKNYWKDSKSLLLKYALHDATAHFNLVGLIDIVKVSTSEVGCHEIYTFGVDKHNNKFMKDIYTTGMQDLLAFVGAFGQKAGEVILYQSHPDQRIKMKTDGNALALNDLTYWSNNWEHVAEHLGHKAQIL